MIYGKHKLKSAIAFVSESVSDIHTDQWCCWVHIQVREKLSSSSGTPGAIQGFTDLLNGAMEMWLFYWGWESNCLCTEATHQPFHKAAGQMTEKKWLLPTESPRQPGGKILLNSQYYSNCIKPLNCMVLLFTPQPWIMDLKLWVKIIVNVLRVSAGRQLQWREHVTGYHSDYATSVRSDKLSVFPFAFADKMLHFISAGTVYTGARAAGARRDQAASPKVVLELTGSTWFLLQRLPWQEGEEERARDRWTVKPLPPQCPPRHCVSRDMLN